VAKIVLFSLSFLYEPLLSVHVIPLLDRTLCLHVFVKPTWRYVRGFKQIQRPHGYSDSLPHRKSNQGFATFRLLVRRPTTTLPLPFVTVCLTTQK